MTIKLLKTFLMIVFILTSYYVGTKISNLDAKESMEYFIPYIIFELGYLLTGIIYLIFREKNLKSLSIQFLISLLPLFLIPYHFILIKSNENQVAVNKLEQLEYHEFLINLKNINEIINEYPDSSILYIKRARLKRSQGLWKESIADSQLSLEKEETTEAYWELGWCQENSGYLNDALFSYQKAANLDKSLEWPQKRIEVVKQRLKKSL